MIRAKHLESGSRDWLPPSERGAGTGTRGFDFGLAIEAILRFVQGTRPDATPETIDGMLNAMAAKRGLDRDGAIRAWAATKQVAQLMLDIDYERKQRAAADRADDGDDLLAEFMAE